MTLSNQTSRCICKCIGIYIYHMFCETVDNGKEVYVVFCGISKAFDRVWHSIRDCCLNLQQLVALKYFFAGLSVTSQDADKELLSMV